MWLCCTTYRPSDRKDGGGDQRDVLLVPQIRRLEQVHVGDTVLDAGLLESATNEKKYTPVKKIQDGGGGARGEKSVAQRCRGAAAFFPNKLGTSKNHETINESNR